MSQDRRKAILNSGSIKTIRVIWIQILKWQNGDGTVGWNNRNLGLIESKRSGGTNGNGQGADQQTPSEASFSLGGE